ncbi:DUF4476 domain-containing protein [Riemerella anatipestifer]|nr:DUF4476 domain-containing protein [Riemerella anatipestifer]
MKSLILTLGLLSSFALGQNHNFKREMLPNEIETQKLNHIKNDFYRNRDNHYSKANTYAELFIRVPNPNYRKYTISISDQTIENRTGYFRFFDLEAGRHQLTVLSNGIPIYRTVVFLRNNQRSLLDFYPFEGLFLVDELPIQQEYPEYPNWRPNGNIMNSTEFQQFLEHFKRQNFDDNKTEVFLVQSQTTSFTSQQVLELIKTMSFDKGRLEVAKAAYAYCPDPQNYYMVSEGFSFRNSKTELSDFILKNKR